MVILEKSKLDLDPATVEELEQAEQEVYQAATQTVKTSSAREIASKMEEATARIRRAELDRLFF